MTEKMMMTSAYANKLLKSLEEEKYFWLNNENESATYEMTEDEKPVIPEYDYAATAKKLAEIDEKVCRLKHAINLSNALAKIPVGGEILSVDMILVRMAQLNRRLSTLDTMRRRLPKKRISNVYHRTQSVAEYTLINYDLDAVKADYAKIQQQITELQLALDRYNLTVEFAVEY